MNQSILRLAQLAEKETRTIIGLMSGTSLDGLDVALCRLSGHGTATKASVVHFNSIPYQDDFRAGVKAIFSKRQVDLEQVCLMNAYIGSYHAELINACLDNWGVKAEEVDVIASHGQTIYHAPASLHGIAAMPNATLQIGDGDHIAVKTGIITLSDFRQKHVAAGGEGAPLAVYGDYLLFSEKSENRILLNIGGISNFTFLPGDLQSGRIFSTDVGPGNTLMDAFVQANFPGKTYDDNAAIALQGRYNAALVSALLEHPFFGQAIPKTTGPELFNLAYLERAQQASGTTSLSPADVMASLNRFTATGIARAVQDTVQASQLALYLSGGGMHNPLLLQNLQELLPDATIQNTEALGILPDAKEAVLFATLANECLAGNQIDLGASGIPAVRMGKISLPD
ncbi:anhydro-N-acetylmuramic acid kinase [Pontibacter sp. HSC-14F20]|uniref:anhydro-N-acetylmuramic acid kinase n=1 Tax=Pontibacter sp. HSC-14F20 TaxID=2864136 RepID=UPI001C72E2ED|nr:anhydro-N-acetylmuramic acid kinase [Pontibacter sp. HSC-14F20]MBX0334220.1 anhydro-N-acetylmuramic acid kinase [Pontibacter sp. HSC-14F20]